MITHIISQKGGLTRYRIGDKVRVSGYYLETPCLSFVGRSGQVCDMVGEKLDSGMVNEILSSILQPEVPALLLPVFSTAFQCYYVLLTEVVDPNLSERLELALQEVYHYRIARLSGQLSSVKVIRINNLLASLHSFYVNQGINRGDIKDSLFIHNLDLAAKFLTDLGV